MPFHVDNCPWVGKKVIWNFACKISTNKEESYTHNKELNVFSSTE